MTRHVAVSFGRIGGTAAGLARTAGGRTLIADRPDGTAGGKGLGFNGAELLAAALGSCFWNDLHYAADAAGAAISVEALDCEVELAGNPPRVVRAQISAALTGAGETALDELFEAARETSTIAASLAPAFPISFSRVPAGAAP